MEPKVIKSDEEYRAFRSEIERLAVMDVSPDTEDGARLELLALLVEEYEKRHFPFDAPDPIEAIQFRMNEQGLRQSDLVSYMGSRSRVSEVLGRKRPLTVQMIRALSRGLGIPADLLVSPIQSEEVSIIEDLTPNAIDWSKFPVTEMARHGYFKGIGSTKRGLLAAQEFILRIFPTGQPVPLFARQGLRGEAVTSKAEYALLAWKARVVFLARRRKAEAGLPSYKAGSVDQTFLQRVVGLSWHPNGVRLACDLVERI
jgi:HTH-type transcriptional regulator/antitoxin HigA